MNCPFCKTEYQSELLQEGRCPRCGGVVEWTSGDTGDFDASKFQPKVTVDLSPRMLSQVRSQSRKANSQNGGVVPQKNSKQERVGNAGGIGNAENKQPHPEQGQGGQGQPDNFAGSNQSDPQTAQNPATDSSGANPRDDVNSILTPDPSISPAGEAGFESAEEQMVSEPQSSWESGDTAKGQQPNYSTDVGKKIKNAWGLAAAGIKSTFSTIRTDQENGADGDSIRVVINERRMRGEDLKSFSSDYNLLSQIGHGAVGVVYAAQQNSIDREVAVKMLQGDAPASGERKEKFLFEAVVTGDLDHPNIVPIHELGKNQKGDLFYSMKKIDGQPWSESIRQKTLTENLDILLKVCDAVAFAHSRGIIHRDLKPENIMLGGYGEVLVVDWGIALPIPGYSKTQILKFKPSISGTPAYMAPEMALGPIEKIGIASDVYLLGAILFEIVAGKPPHEGENALQCVMAAAKNKITAVQTSEEPISIAMRALETAPSDRYESVGAFKQALNSYQSHIESISLANRAQESFDAAMQSRNYEDFSKALFAYEEALELWPANERAVKGIRQTNFEYAKCALEKSDFELGLSRVDLADKESQVLGNRLKSGAMARDRRKSLVSTLRNVAIALVLLIIGGGTFFLNERGKNLKDANDQRVIAEKAQKRAEGLLQQKEETILQREKAIRREEKAKKEKDQALKKEEKAKEDAEKAKEDAQNNLEKLQEANYATNLDVVEERIDQNAFMAARILVSDMANNNPGLLHWEWGRIDFLCNGLSELIKLDAELPADQIKVIDIAAKSGQIAVGEVHGRFHILNPDQSQKELTLADDEGESSILNDLAFDPTGQWLAVAGKIEKRLDNQTTQSKGVVRLWKLGQMGLDPVRLPDHGTEVTAIAFSVDGKSLLTAADDNSIKLWSLASRNVEEDFAGHQSRVHDIDFDPSGNQFVTSSEKDVRIWKIGMEQPYRRFTEHRCPVYSVRFIENGKVVLSGDSQGRLFRWTVENSSFLEKSRPSDSKDDIPSRSLIEETSERVRQLAKKDGKTEGFLTRNETDTQILVAHQKSIRQINLSLKGNSFLTASDDNVVRIWSLSNDARNFSRWKSSKELRGHGGSVYTAVFGLEDKTVFSGGQDRQVRKWNIDNQSNFGVSQIANQTGRNLSVALSPGRDWIALGKTDGTTILQSIHEPEQQKKLTSGHDYLSTSTVLTPDRKILITAGGDNTARIWDFQKGTETKVIRDSGRRALLCLSRDGRFFATGNNRGDAIRVFDVVTQDLIHEFSAPPRFLDGKEQKLDFATADLSLSGKYLLAGDSYGNCYLWETSSKTQIAGWKGHFGGVVKVAFFNGDDRPDSLQFVTAGRESMIATWRLTKKNNSAKSSGLEPQPGRPIAVNNDQILVKTVISKTDNQILSMVELDKSRQKIVAVKSESRKKGADSVVSIEALSVTGEDRRETRMDASQVHSVCFVDDAGLFIAFSDANKNSRLFYWNLAENKNPELYVDGRDFAGVNQMLLVSETNELLTVGGKGVQRWSLQSGELLMDYRRHAQTSASAFSPDGRYLITGGSEGAANIWETETGLQKSRIQHPDLRAITALLFVNEKNFLMSDQRGNLFECSWDGKNMESCKPLYKHSSGLAAICHSPERDLIIAAGIDGKIIVWNTSSKSVVANWQLLEGVTCLAISPNGRILAAGTSTNVVLWDVDQGVELTQVAGHSAAIQSLEFSPDGLRLLSAGLDGQALLWDLTPTLRLDTENRKGEKGKIQISEIFSLSNTSNALLAAHFVNQGTDILVSSKNGISKISGSQLDPAIRLTRHAIEIERNSNSTIDSSLIFSVPTVRQNSTIQIELALANEQGQAYSASEYFQFRENKNAPIRVIDSNNQLELVARGRKMAVVGELEFDQGKLKVTMDLDSGYLFSFNEVLRSIALQPANLEDEKINLKITLSEIQDGVNRIIQREFISVRLVDQKRIQPVRIAPILPLAIPVSRVQR